MRTNGIASLAKPEISRFPLKERPHMPGSPTTPGWAGARDDAPVHVAFREFDHVGTQIVSSFRGSMAGLCAPLPTLRRHPRECQRTARGRCGSLLLHRGGLAPPTLCRFDRRTINLALLQIMRPHRFQRVTQETARGAFKLQPLGVILQIAADLLA